MKISNLRRNELKSFFVGCLLGDGCIAQFTRNTGKAHYFEGHSKKQEKYLQWKLDVIAESMNVATSIRDVTVTVKGKEYKVVHGRSTSSKYFGKLHQLFYGEEKKDKKRIPIEFVRRHFTELSLAILMLDDGYIQFNNKAKGNNPTSAEIAICGFTFEDQTELVKIIEEKTGIRFNLRKLNKGKYNRLRITGKEATQKLIEIMRPYITDDTLYKIDYSVRKIKSARETADTQVV